jgi:hypothetical protein
MNAPEARSTPGLNVVVIRTTGSASNRSTSVVSADQISSAWTHQSVLNLWKIFCFVLKGFFVPRTPAVAMCACQVSSGMGKRIGLFNN